MKILIVTNMYPTSEDPGFGSHVRSQVDSLTQKGLSIELVFVNGRAARRNYLKGAWQVFRRSLRTHYDVVHAHYGLSGFLARCQMRSPVVVSFCGTDVMDKIQGRLSRLISRFVDLSIVKSTVLKNTLRGKRVTIIPNGIDLDLFQPQDQDTARKALGLSSEIRYLLIAGHPSNKVKRFDVARRTHQLVKDRFRQEVELLILHGRPHHEVPLYLNACDLLLVTSDWEGSPNIVKEAMACNIPIVSTDVGDVRDIIGGTSNCHICPQDPEKLSEKILSTLENGRRTDGRTKISHLSLAKTADAIIGAYRQLARRRSCSVS
jgi:teichuronic acid biosynthesis glycosyltransferase TuaC